MTEASTGPDEPPAGPLGKPDWETLYREEAPETLPWYSPELDHDLVKALTENGITGGRVLDLGAGPGTQAIELARRGFEVTATDVSESAVRRASEAASREGVAVRFIVDDILNSSLTGPFDLVFDRGCFHVLPPNKRPVYVERVARLIDPGHSLFLKGFSEEETREGGPHRFSPVELDACFKNHFKVLSICRTQFDGTEEPPPKALFAVMRRI